MGANVKLVVLTLLILTANINAKVLTDKVNVVSIKKESKDQYLVIFREKSALFKSSSKFLDCLNISITKKKPILIKWDINKLAITGCKSKRK